MTDGKKNTLLSKKQEFIILRKDRHKIQKKECLELNLG